MGIKTLNRTIAVLAIFMLLLSVLPAVMAANDDSANVKPDSVYMVITKQGDTMAGSDISRFSVKEMAIRSEDGNAKVFTFDKPLQGVCDMKNNMAYISTADIKSAQISQGKADKLSLDTNGSSMIVKLDGIKTLYKSDDYKLMDFNEVYIISPDGKAKEFQLEKPVKITYSKPRNILTIDAYPSFIDSIKEFVSGSSGMTFGSQSLSLHDIKNIEGSAQQNSVVYEKPMTSGTTARETSVNA